MNLNYRQLEIKDVAKLDHRISSTSDDINKLINLIVN